MAFELLNFETPIDMLAAIWPRFSPYSWQVRDHLWLAGYRDPVSATDFGPYTRATAQDPATYILQAANGSGKDSVMGAGFMPWFICTRPRAKAICTSASASQVFDQTEKPCRMVVDALNGLLGHKRFEYVLRSIVDTRAKSEIKFFATDDPGKAEGHHPAMDYADAELAVLMNEVKSLEESITDAVERNHGYSYWIEYSSPGAAYGHFYESCQLKGPNTRVSKVTAYDCPHISKTQIEKMIKKFGIGHPLVRSSLFAEFTEMKDLVLIPGALVRGYDYMPRWNDGLLRAGIDLGLGGDEAVMYVYKGSRFVACKTTTTDNAVELVRFFIAHLQNLGVSPDNVNVDGSGIGKPIISIFNERNFPVNSIKNDDKPKDPNFYLNRGAEIWDKGKSLIQRKCVELPEDAQFLKELTTRRSEILKGKLRLECKRKARIAGRPSPNRADAWMLVWANVDREEIKVEFDEKGRIIAEEVSKQMPRNKIRVADVSYDDLIAQGYTHSHTRASRFRPTSLYT